MRASQLRTGRRDATAATAARTAATVKLSDSARSEPLLGRYRLVRHLGAGAFGVVWMARDERLGREVAIKILPRERIVGGRFEREARAAARLAHPGIVTLYEAAVDDEGAYLVSELVRGETLQALLAQGRLSDRDVVTIAISLCDALAHAHAHGVIHRDVKPSNILVADSAGSPACPAKLTDFGVARVIGGDSLTRTGDVVGTAAYMAPEQAEGREADAAADLYALALIVYEALTGVNPVRTSSPATRARRLATYLPPLRRRRRDLPRSLGGGIDLALRPRARERGTVNELRGALLAALPGLGEAPGLVVGAWQRPRAAAQPELPGPPPFASPAAPLSAPPDAGQPEGDHPLDPTPRPGPRWPARALGAATAALITAWLAGHVLGRGSPPPAMAALVAGAIVLLLPRLGWLAMTLFLVTGATLGGHLGAALLLAPTLLVPVVLLPRSGGFWGLPAAAPVLGLAVLAGAWPALAAHASRSAWRRAALGGVGWMWLALAAPLAGRGLYARLPAGVPAPRAWMPSAASMFHEVLVPILSSRILLGAPVWGLAAAVLPWLLRRRSLAIDVALAVVWSAITVAGVEVAIATVKSPVQPISGNTVATGALAGCLVAVVPSALSARRRRRHAQGPDPQLP